VANLALADEIAFLGTARIPSTLSFDITYTRSGKPRKIVPSSRDPLSAFHWVGEMWKATNSGTFSVAHNDGSFSATGSFSSSGLFGEMGTERNGVFVHHDDDADNEDAAGAAQESVEPAEQTGYVQSSESAMLPAPLRARMRGIAR
jgi:hypothetical protein